MSEGEEEGAVKQVGEAGQAWKRGRGRERARRKGGKGSKREMYRNRVVWQKSRQRKWDARGEERGRGEGSPRALS